jgi:hypothetical protein
LLLLIVQTLPLDVMLSRKDFRRKWYAGAIGWLPGAFSRGDMVEVLTRQSWEVLCFAPLGVLAAHFPGERWQQYSGWLRVLGLGLAISAIIEVAQLFVASHSTEVLDVLFGASAALVGWAAALTMKPRLDGGSLRRWLIFAWLALAVYVNGQPPHSGADASLAWGRSWERSWAPLSRPGDGEPLNALEGWVHRIILFALLGVLLAFPGILRPMAWVFWAVLVPAATAACLKLELWWIAPGYGRFSDVLGETAAATLGFTMAGRLQVPAVVRTAQAA